MDNKILLTEGVWTNKQLADFMGIAEKTFKNSRKEKLEDLRDFAEFEVGRGKIMITKIINEGPYISKRVRNSTKAVVHKNYDQEWQEYDTCVRCGTTIHKKEKLTTSVSTAINCVRKERMEAYGSPAKRNGGSKGFCEYKWVKSLMVQEDEERFRPLNEDEKKWLQEIAQRIYGKDCGLDLIQRQAALYEAFIKKEISEQEYIELLKESGRTNYCQWMDVVGAMYSEHNIVLKRVTHSIKTAW